MSRYLDPEMAPRRDYRPFLAGMVLVAGLVAIVLVAPRQGHETALPAPAPTAGSLLTSGQDSALLLGVLRLEDEVLVVVRFLRGERSGKAMYSITGCPDRGTMIDVSTGAARAWERGEKHIFAVIASAACGAPGNTQEQV